MVVLESAVKEKDSKYTSDGLINIDVLKSSVVSVVFDIESDCCILDGLTLEPADALKLENAVIVAAE